MVGIFIKTCKKDHEWLRYCLMSIEKFATGFEGICLLTDSDHNNITELKSIITKMPIEITQVPVPTGITHNCQDGVGYIWMQHQKLNWHNYCKYDAVLQIDSDSIITSNFNVNDYYTEVEDDIVKYKWWTRPWNLAEGAICHKEPLAKLFKLQPLSEHMLFNGWLMTRSDTTDFHKWLKNTWKCDYWHYLIVHANSDWGGTKRGSSIYNTYGMFIQQIKRSNIYVFIEKWKNIAPIKQFWSWGGITPEIKIEIHNILELA